ncbi:MAG: hypothetical protein JNM28_03200 [Armatimonadetes bacterium]|nr:hypothetical protein [Armatimonadota bacterium]MBS1711181.1 hypothetical protein [Armatimonadota bacterium]MBX3108855.1 hypothetical protein [Fimbriimonadaceae bacterium]
MRCRWLSLSPLLLGLGGCYISQLPDPNDVQGAQRFDAEIMQRNIATAYSTLDLRVQRGEMTPQDRDRHIKELVDRIAGYIKPDDVRDAEAWRVADIYRQAGDLDNAKKFYERAIKVAKTEDRRVNDTLQYARVLALAGDVPGAVAKAVSTFDAPPKEKAPIMMACLYEIVPAGLGKGHDIELADLLEKSISQHMQVQVDPGSAAGRTFLETSPIHIGKAWERVMQIYAKAGRDDLLRKAIERRDKMADKAGKV